MPQMGHCTENNEPAIEDRIWGYNLRNGISYFDRIAECLHEIGDETI